MGKYIFVWWNATRRAARVSVHLAYAEQARLSFLANELGARLRRRLAAALLLKGSLTILPSHPFRLDYIIIIYLCQELFVLCGLSGFPLPVF